MKKFRKSIKYLFPVVIGIMVLGLILSRVYQPEPSVPEAEVTISAFDASEYIGQAVEVCGRVESVDYVETIRGNPTFLNLGREYPDQPFTAVIWGEDRQKWRFSPDREYIHREICITGRVEEHEGVPQIRVYSPEQIRLRQ